jgi:amidohydrolase
MGKGIIEVTKVMNNPTPIANEEIMARARGLHERIRTWRRTIHRHPELSFTEVKTARLVTGVLHDLGIETETGVAKTGVVGHLEGSSGPVVGLRADMDALPVQEENGTGYDSELPGLMHACGHDSHTAMLLGAATILKGFADDGRLPGTVRLLFQPSEENRDDEGKSGGMRMVEEGALDKLDAVFGLHVDTRGEVGSIGSRPGPMMAAGDMFDLTVRGFGGHGARPHAANDPIVLSAHVIHAVQNVLSRRLNPLEPGVISICMIHGGTASNVIPETIEMSGTIRSMSEDTRRLLHEELRRACGVVEALGGSFELDIKHGYPSTVNDPEATELAFETLGQLLGEEKVVERDAIMASEDFSFMLHKAPGCFLRLGVKNPSWEREYPVHTSTFRMDEDALPVGAAAMATLAIRWMEQRR